MSRVLGIIALLLLGGHVLFAAKKTPQKAHCQICWIREGSGEEPVVAWSEYQGRTFHFCSEACKAEFLQDPSLWSIDPVATTDTAGFVTSVPT